MTKKYSSNSKSSEERVANVTADLCSCRPSSNTGTINEDEVINSVGNDAFGGW